MQDSGLQQNYLTDPLFQDDIHMIQALSLVPVQDVILVFDELCNHCDIDEQSVLDYFGTNYIGDFQRGRRLLPLFPHELWNMHNQVSHKLPQTNNNHEGWQLCFSIMFKQTHPSIWEFNGTLKVDASDINSANVSWCSPVRQKGSIVMSRLVSQHLCNGMITEISYLFYVAFMIT